MTSITNSVTQRLSGKAGHVRSVVSFNRPAAITAYAVGDVVSDDAAAAKVMEFEGCGVSGSVVGAELVYGETDTVNFELWLFDQEPTNFQDNDPLALVAADLPKFAGVLAFADSGKHNGGSNVEVYKNTDREQIAYTSDNGSLYGLLVTRSAFTPRTLAPVAVNLHIDLDE
jgi:hypothetical protein